MADHGITLKVGDGGARVELECEHQSGVLYTVPGEMSWVCDADMLPAHAMAGFLKELVKLESPQVEAIMQRWGVYYRERPLAPPPAAVAEESAPTA